MKLHSLGSRPASRKTVDPNGRSDDNSHLINATTEFQPDPARKLVRLVRTSSDKNLLHCAVLHRYGEATRSLVVDYHKTNDARLDDGEGYVILDQGFGESKWYFLDDQMNLILRYEAPVIPDGRMVVADVLCSDIPADSMMVVDLLGSGISDDRTMVADHLCSGIAAVRTIVAGLFCSYAEAQTAIWHCNPGPSACSLPLSRL